MINRRRGITTLVNLHNVEFAREFADRIVALRAGRKVFDGAPQALDQRLAAELYLGDESEAEQERMPLVVSA